MVLATLQPAVRPMPVAVVHCSSNFPKLDLFVDGPSQNETEDVVHPTIHRRLRAKELDNCNLRCPLRRDCSEMVDSPQAILLRDSPQAARLLLVLVRHRWAVRFQAGGRLGWLTVRPEPLVATPFQKRSASHLQRFDLSCGLPMQTPRAPAVRQLLARNHALRRV